MEINERVILLTGSSGGLGTAMAKHLQERGFRLALHYHNNRPSFEEDENLRCYVADLRDLAKIDSMMRQIELDFGRLDVVINNAGISRNGMSWKLDFEDWHNSIAVNLTAPFYICQKAIPLMRKQSYGRIVNISSVVGQMGFIGTSAYAASKSGLFGLTKTLSKELAAFQISVNSFALGYFNEGMIRDVPADLQQEIIQQIPLKKLGNVSAITNALDFVIDEQSTYFTGQVLNINGGLH
jgi:NAD(P)-dependent dehydrogenase (short-subunit alcohol dehydrogenase family)